MCDTFPVSEIFINIKIIFRQKGSEYGLTELEKPRATDVTKMDQNLLQKLPADNLACERHFSLFDILAKRSAMSASRKFKAIGKTCFCSILVFNS